MSDGLLASVDRGLAIPELTRLRGVDDRWTAFVPTWTTTGTQPSIQNGVLKGRYQRIGRVVTAAVHWRGGSSTTYGTGDWKFAMPFTKTPSTVIECKYPCIVTGVNGGVAEYLGMARFADDTSVEILEGSIAAAGGTARWSFNTPFTWGSGDELSFLMVYEAN